MMYILCIFILCIFYVFALYVFKCFLMMLNTFYLYVVMIFLKGILNNLKEKIMNYLFSKINRYKICYLFSCSIFVKHTLIKRI